VETLYIDPGSPRASGYAETFHSRLCDEFLALEMFESPSAAKRLTKQWRDDYNHHRPHSSLGYVTQRSSRPAVLLPFGLRPHSSSTAEIT
jgi:transposase InsO family protein